MYRYGCFKVLTVPEQSLFYKKSMSVKKQAQSK